MEATLSCRLNQRTDILTHSMPMTFTYTCRCYSENRANGMGVSYICKCCSENRAEEPLLNWPKCARLPTKTDPILEKCTRTENETLQSGLKTDPLQCTVQMDPTAVIIDKCVGMHALCCRVVYGKLSKRFGRIQDTRMRIRQTMFQLRRLARSEASIRVVGPSQREVVWGTS